MACSIAARAAGSVIVFGCTTRLMASVPHTCSLTNFTAS